MATCHAVESVSLTALLAADPTIETLAEAALAPDETALAPLATPSVASFQTPPAVLEAACAFFCARRINSSLVD